MSNLSSVGILGDGQLAQMMCLEAQKLNIPSSVLAKSADSPAVLAGAKHFLSSSDGIEDYLEFAKKFKPMNSELVLTIESEFIDPVLLKEIEQKTGIKVYPQPHNLEKIRDRLPQKKLMIENDIPTSPLSIFKTKDELQALLKTNKSLVLKKRLFGYDGYGTLILNNKNDFNKLDSDFNPKDWIAEDFISFKKEFAFSFARNLKGQICDFPLVESFQENAKCLWVKGPVAENESIKKLRLKIHKLLQDLDYVGFITFELFLTEDNNYLVNEIAPRVHNSAHYSLEALYLNQFKAHLLAVLNFDLPKSPEVIAPFAMLNLIGKTQRPSSECHLPKHLDQIFLHWYQKNECRPGRKMGHMTSLASTSDEALLKLKDKFGEFKL